MGIVTLGIPSEITLELAAAHQATVFIETGTYHGQTTRWAANHFDSVYTIERAEGLFNRYSPELSTVRGVTPLLGDSRKVLPSILNDIGSRRAVFWLDGHWSGGDTAGASDECPLLEELNCLEARPDDIILIDDARLFLCAPPSPHNPGDWPTISEVVRSVSRYGSRYIQICDDVIFAVPDKESVRTCLTNYAQRRSEAFWELFAKLQRG